MRTFTVYYVQPNKPKIILSQHENDLAGANAALEYWKTRFPLATLYIKAR